MFRGWFDRNARLCKWADPEIYGSDRCPQWPWEIGTLAILFAEMNPKLVVEIGVERGGSLRYWLGAIQAGGRIIAIDPSPQCKVDHPSCTLLAMRSDEALEQVRAAGPVDFLFIDGDHSYDGARWDWMNYGPLVRPGGIIAFHDIGTLGRDDCQVKQLWREIQAAGYLTRELQAPHNWPPGGGIGVVYVEEM